MSPFRNSLRDLLFIMFKRKKMILYTIGSIAVCTFIYTLLKTPIYTASTKVYIKGVIYDESLYNDQEMNTKSMAIGPERLNTEIAIIKSRPVIEKVASLYGLHNYKVENLTWRDDFKAMISWPKVQLKALLKSIFAGEEEQGDSDSQSDGNKFQKAVIKLQKSVNASAMPFSRVIVISYDHRDPKMASEIVNSVTEEYLRRHLIVNINQGKSFFYKDQMNSIRQKLNLMEEQFSKFKSKEEIISYDEQEQGILRNIQSYENALTEVRKVIISQQNKLDKLKYYILQNPDKIIPSKEIAEKPLIARLYAELIGLRLRLSELSQKYTDENRMVIETKSQITDYEFQLREQVSKEVELESTSLDKLLAEEHALESTVTQLRASLLSLPRKEITYKTMEENIQHESLLLRSLRERYEEAVVEEASDNRASMVTALEFANIPLGPSSPKMKFNLILSLFLGILISLVLAFGLELLDHTINTPEDSEHYLNIGVLGSIEEA